MTHAAAVASGNPAVVFPDMGARDRDRQCGPAGPAFVWSHPKVENRLKDAITVGTLLLTWLMYESMVASLKMLEE